MSLLLWIIFGAVAGWIASMLTGEDARMGGLANIVVGILGAILGGWIVSLVAGYSVTGFNIGSLLVAIGGAVILILIARSFMGTRSHV